MKWDYMLDEEVFDENPNYIGIITNGKRFLFYHGLTTGEEREEEFIYPSLSDLCYTGNAILSFPWSAENEEKFIEFLNSQQDKWPINFSEFRP